MLTNLVQKGPIIYCCETCDFKSSQKSKYERHLNTRKHYMLTHTDEKGPEPLFVCDCGKNYKYRQSLSVHKKKCLFLKNVQNNSIIEYKENIIETIDSDKKEDEEENGGLKELVYQLITENNEIKNSLLKENNNLMKENKELREQVTELIPKVGNNNTTNIQNNNKFNINVFLNEKCKDAINMKDFIKSIEITLQQLDYTISTDLEKGISKTIMENMNKLSVYERPLHCTDIKRETLYIKDNDKWEKDKTKSKIKQAINDTSNKNYGALKMWKETNPDFMEDDSKKDYFIKTISTIGKSSNSVDDKIIKKLCKETYVKNAID